ncbi:MAG: DUF1257 domain-containing protein [Caldilineaceae bacterium]
MSKFVKISTELRDLNMIKRSLADLKLNYAENQRFVHRWSGYDALTPLVVKTNRAHFGLRSTDDGVYEVIGDDMQMKQLRATLDQIQQRYAYHKVLAEVEQAGFSLVEEKTGADNVIRLTVRRWN